MGGVGGILAMAGGVVLIYLAYSGKAAAVWAALTGGESVPLTPPTGGTGLPENSSGFGCKSGMTKVAYRATPGTVGCVATTKISPKENFSGAVCPSDSPEVTTDSGAAMCMAPGTQIYPLEKQTAPAQGGEGPRSRWVKTDTGSWAQASYGGYPRWMR